MTLTVRGPGRARIAALLATVSALAFTATANHAAAGTTIDGTTDTVPGTFASPLVADGGLVVGVVGTGELDVGAGAGVSTTNCVPTIVGQSATGNGTIKLNGGHLDDGFCGIDIGEGGTGLVDVTNGGYLLTTFSNGLLGGSVIGNAAGSHGTANLTGVNSEWVYFGITIGASGTGAVNVDAGTYFEQTGCHPTTLGANATGAGAVTVSGAQANWINGSCSLVIGDSGNGTVTVTSAGEASQFSNVTLGRTLSTSSGTITVDGANSQFVSNGNLVVGGAGVGKIMVTAGAFLADGNATLGQLVGSSGTVTVDGANSLWGSGGSVSVGEGGTGTFTLSNGGSIIDATADIWNGGIGVYGAGSSWASSGDVIVGNGGSAVIQVYNGGDISVGGGTGTLTLGGTGATHGQIVIGGDLNPTQAPGTLEAGNLLLATASSEIVFHHTSSNYVFGVPISGPGQVAVAAGVTDLTGCSTYSGNTIVSGGTLLVDGSLGATNLTVQSASALGGSGSILGPVTIDNGAVLLGAAGQTLTTGSLVLNTSSIVQVSLGSANATPLFQVNGPLTLDGQLDITNTGGFGPGLYRLFDYTGALSDYGLAIGTVPSGVPSGSLSVQTSTAGEVNLVFAGGALQFWNGAVLAPAGSVVGGAGTWKVGPTNWTDSAGALSGGWSGIFAIFAGTAGAVSIDNSGGAVDATGLQFAVDGYSVGGAALTLAGASPTIRVGDGTAAGAGYTATIGSVIAGSAGLTKTDLGVLTLSGTNTYTGGTSVTGGVLAVGADVNLGAASGSVTLNGGTLIATASLTSNRVFDIQQTSAIGVAGGDTFDINGGLIDSGLLSAAGPGVLRLTGVNSFSGPLSVAGGALEVDGSLAGHVLVQTGGTLEGAGSIAMAAVVSGTLKGLDGQTLTMGSLVLTSGASVDATLGAPSATALFDDQGALTLDGQLNVHDGGGFGAGVYRLIDYSGALTDDGLVIGATPPGVSAASLTIQTSIPDQVNLIYATGTPMQFWNGSTLAPTGSIVGGAGFWRVGPTNWTDAAGASAGAWGGSDAIFAGKAGAVSVDDSGGVVGADFLQFAVDGYRVEGDPLTLTGAVPTIRVGDGTAAGAADVATIDSVLAGTHGLVKTDLGTLVLTGANSYGGGTTFGAGVLSVDADANLGAASGGLTFDGGALTATSSFTSNRSVDFAGAGEIADDAGVTLTLTGPLSGGGALDKSGAGVLDLAGAGSYAGPIAVDAGTLQVNGQVGGSVTVHSGARLQGTGTVGATTVASGGTLAPGNSIGTISVVGDVTFQPGAVYEVQLNAAGQSDQIRASGMAHILGGTVTAQSAAGRYSLGTGSTIVAASGGVSGAFAGISQGLGQPFLQLGLSYDADHVYLVVTRSALSFCQAAVTKNQCAVAGAAESLGEGGAVYDAIADLPDLASGPRAFNMLSGELHATLRGVEVEDSRFVRDAAIGRLQAPDDGRSLWGQVFAAQGSADAGANAAGVSRTVDGWLMGVDTPAGKAWRLGVIGGYSQTRFSIGARSSSGNSDDYHLGAYGGVTAGPLNGRFGAAYTWRNIATARSVAFDGFADAEKSAQAASLVQLFGDVGLPLERNGRGIEPFAGLAYVSLHGGAFNEAGGPAALKGAGADSQTSFATLGVRGEAQGVIQGAAVSLRASLAWRGAYGDVVPQARLAFATGGSAFSIDGAPVARNAVAADVDLSVRLSRRARLSVDYNDVAAAGAGDQSLKLSANFSF